MAAIGIGVRYERYSFVDARGEPQWIPFHLMDTPLITIVVVLFCTLIVGIGLAIVGLAYHHHRRHHEMFGSRDARVMETRQPVG